VIRPLPFLPVLLCALPAALPAQGVLVAPHAVFIDHASRAGSISLYNPGSDPVEVGVSFGFGYPQTDSAGTMYVEVADTAPAGAPSAAPWLQAFPRRVVVAPQSRQTVRLLATPPPGLPDGEYWARVIVSASGGKVPVAGVPDTGAVRVGINLEVRTVIAIVYRKGAVTTGVHAGAPTAAYRNDTVTVRLPLERTGTSAYLGTFRASVADASGRVVGSDSLPLAVYYSIDPRLSIPVGTLAPGRYTVHVDVTASRPDLPPRTVLPVAPVRDSVEVTAP
jgi:hypothetical protein